MKALYFDCFTGISGDMTVGALVDLGVDPKVIESELEKLQLQAEYELQWETVVKKGITATKMNVLLKNKSEHHPAHHHVHSDEALTPQHEKGHEKEDHDHTHEHLHDHGHDHHHAHSHSDAHSHSHDHSHDQGHSHRHYKHIVEMIQAAGFNEKVTDMSLRIFEKIGRAEGKIHNLPLEQVHFHEVGAIDSIVDIVATAIAIDQIKPEKIIASAVPVGSGTIHIDHGIYPVPAPATLDILKNLPLKHTDLTFELTTPTGAGIIAALVDEFSTFPSIRVEQIGYGAGTKNFPDRPNVLRVLVGELG